MPERLMSADPDFFITKKLAKTEQGLSFFGKEALEEYKRCFRNPATVHAMCEDYRATATVDLAMDTRGLRRRSQDRLSGAAPVGRDRRGRAQPQAGRGVDAIRRPTSAAPRRCPAGTISPKRRPRKPTERCARFFRCARHEAAGPARSSLYRADHISARDRAPASSRNSRTTYHNRWRLLLKIGLCAVFGRMTNCRSPFGSCR